jgi:hypothetical protein
MKRGRYLDLRVGREVEKLVDLSYLDAQSPDKKASLSLARFS